MSTRTKTSDFFVAGGTLHPDTPSYVERPADDELFNLTLASEFCYVLTPRQMGKSSLMVRTARRLQAEGVRTAIIDLTAIGISAEDTWYLDLLSELADELALSVDPEAWWQARASQGQVRRFINFLRNVVLTEITGQVVIFIDEIDTTPSLDFSDDFFAAIRAMYNARAKDPAFNRLTFVLVGVATPSDLIGDQARTPFNIGQAVDLQELSWADARVLQSGWSEIDSDQRGAVLERIFHWTNGHPYLTQKLCLAVAESKSEKGRWTDEQVDELVEDLFLSEEARKEANLKFVRDRILTYPQSRQLLALYRRVYEGKGVGDDERSRVQNQLKLSGLVKAENRYLRVRNEIYRRAFDLAWVRENVAVNWAPIVIGILASLLLLAVGFISHDIWVEFQFQNCENAFLKAVTSEERFAPLTRAFRLRTLLLPTNYDHRAREWFYGLPREHQLALFDAYKMEDKDLVVVIEGLYVALADVDGMDSTGALLGRMAMALHRLGTEEAAVLRGEIDDWLEGRSLAKQSLYAEALAAYDSAIAKNGENPATRYERASVLIELLEYQLALSDLEQVIAIARRSPEPTPTPLPSSVKPITSSVVLTTTSTPMPGIDTPPIQTPPPDAGLSTTEIAPGVTAISTSSPIPTGTPTPTPTPEPAPIVSEFATLGQMISAVRDLIYSNPDLVSFLASASSSEYPNLRESGLVPTPTPTPTSTPTSPTRSRTSTPTTTYTATGTPTSPTRSRTPSPTSIPTLAPTYTPTPTEPPSPTPIMTPRPTFPSTSTPTPSPANTPTPSCSIGSVEPEDGARFTKGQEIRFQWTGSEPEEGWYYEVRVDGQSIGAAWFNPSLQKWEQAWEAKEGEHIWQVVLMAPDHRTARCSSPMRSLNVTGGSGEASPPPPPTPMS